MTYTRSTSWQKGYCALLILSFSSLLPTTAQTTVRKPLANPVIPPSPDAASLGKFGEVPVSEYTGVPTISVPLYTLTSRDIALPLSLNYHAGGVRVQEDASWVGLGWALRAGGSISRTIRGGDDLDYSRNGFIYQPEITDITSNTLNSAIGGGTIDSQPDLFNLDVGGISVRFVLQKGQTNSAGQLTNGGQLVGTILNPTDNTQIRGTKNANGDFTWTVTTPDGFIYKFDLSGREITFALAATGQNPTSPSTSYDYVGSTSGTVTTWNLTEINSPLGEKVTLTYQTKYRSRGLPSVTEEYYRPSSQLTQFEQGVFSEVFRELQRFSFSRSYTQHAYLASINFGNGSVSFDTQGDTEVARDDIEKDLYNGARKLISVTLKNTDGVAQRKWLFTYNYFQSTLTANYASMPHLSKRLRLDRIAEVDVNNETVSLNPYQFYYNGFDGSQYPLDLLPLKNSQATDEYGFYNGTKANDLLASIIPSTAITTPWGESLSYTNSIDRQVRATEARKGVLERIVYPTGGTTTLTYETHRARVPANTLVQRTEAATGVTSFSLATTALVNIQAYLSGYPRTTDPVTGQCSCISIRDRSVVGSTPWLTIKNSSNVVVYTLTYNDVYGQLPQTTCDLQFNQNRTLPAGVYSVSVSPQNNYNQNPNILHTAGAVLYSIGTGAGGFVGVPADVGGLRVSTLTHTDGTNSYKKQYSYTLGKIMNPIIHAFPRVNFLVSYQSGTNATAYVPMVTFTSWNMIPGGNSAQGSYVGYDTVTVANLVLEGGNWVSRHGNTRYIYQNRSDSLALASFLLPNFPVYPNTGNGRPQQERSTNDGGNPVKLTQYTDSRLGETVVKGFVPYQLSYTNQATQATQVQYGLAGYLICSDYWRTDRLVVQEYGLTGTEALTTTTQNTFNPAYRTLEKVATNDSRGQLQESSYSYPYSPAYKLTPPYITMVDQNRVNTVIEKVTTSNATFVEKIIKSYAQFPASNSLILLSKLVSRRQGETDDVVDATYSYDGLGNVASITKRDQSLEQYQWYTDAARKNLLQRSTLAQAGDNALSRSTTYDYYPLVGLKSVQDPNNFSTSYEYDRFKRLSVIRDHTQNILKTFQYNYAGAPVYDGPAISPNFKRILIVGNSITRLIAQTGSDGWQSPALSAAQGWGRAASSTANDFAHLLEQRFQKLDASARVLPLWEAPWEYDYVNNRVGWPYYDYNALKNKITTFFGAAGPDLVIIRLGENVNNATVEPNNFKAAYNTLIDQVLSVSSPGAKVILTNSFWDKQPQADVRIGEVASERNLPLVSLSDMRQNPVYVGGNDVATLAAFPNDGGDIHPGDAGMLEIADRIWGKLLQKDPQSTVGSTVTKARIYPRTDCCIERFTGSSFQGSNDTTNVSGWTTLATITEQPQIGKNDYPIYTDKPWRFLRFVAGPNCHGELVELEFYNGSSKLTGTAFGSASTYLNSPAQYGFRVALDRITTGNTFWHGTAPGSQNFAGVDIGVGCAQLTATVISPVNNATVIGTASNLTDGRVTCAVSVSTCVPSGLTVSSVEVWAALPDGGFPNRMGYAVADPSRPGVFTLSSGEGSTNGQWPIPYLNPGTYRFFAVVTTGATSMTTAFNVITLAAPPPPGPVTKVSILPRYNCNPPNNTCLERTVGGIFQGSDDNVSWTQLGTIPAAIVSVSNGFYDVALTAGKTYRYLRYVAATNCYGELYELQFWSGSTRLRGTPFGSAGTINNDPSYSFTKAFDNDPATLWHGTTPGPQNFAGLDVGCSSASIAITAPVANATVTGNAVAGNTGVTCPFTVNVCAPTGKSISEVAIIASTTDGSIVRRVGNAVAIPGSPGSYSLSSTTVASGVSGGWLPPTGNNYPADPNAQTGPLSPGPFKFWTQAKFSDGSTPLQSTTMTITLMSPGTLAAFMLSPANNTNVVGTAVSGSSGVTIPFSVSVNNPASLPLGQIAIVASTVDNSIVRKVGNLVAVNGSPGSYSLSSTTVASGVSGGWLPPTGNNYPADPNAQTGPLSPGPFKFWIEVRQNDGTVLLNTAPVTVTLSAPASCIPPGAPVIATSSVLLCSGQTATLTSTGCSGVITWSSGQTGASVVVQPAVNTNYTATCTVSGCTSSASNLITVNVPSTMPVGWTTGTVGSPPVAGCATKPQTGNLTVKGVGNVPGATNDAFPYVYRTVSGDVTLVAKVAGIPATALLGDGPRAGIIIRNSTATNASFVWIVQEANGAIGNFRRPTDGGAATFGPAYASGTVNGLLGQAWIKLVKTGTTINSYYSTNANPDANNAWVLLNTYTDISLGSNFLVGFTAFNYNYGVTGATNNTTITEAVFSNVTLNGVSF